MGYMTKFDLRAYDAATSAPISDELEHEITYRLEQIAFNTKMTRQEFEAYWHHPVSFESWTGDEMKWYGHENDMAALSKEYPNVLFILNGVGEEFPDAWCLWAQNGAVEKVYAEIKIPSPTNPMFASWSV